MTVAGNATGVLSVLDHRVQLRRAVIASTIGTTIEWYDFFLYSTVTGLVFAKLYFPESDPLVGTLQAFGIYAVGFVARPIGPAIVGNQFLDWGWRIPFSLSIILVGIGLYIRLGILETPTFSRLVAENRVEKTPALEVIKRQPKEILLTALARTGEQAPFYIFTAFIFTYGTTILGVSRNLLLTAVLTASVVSFFSIPFSGYLSYRIGRNRMYLLGAAVTGNFAFLSFSLL